MTSLFKEIFPDSNIAQKYSAQEHKIQKLVEDGLANVATSDILSLLRSFFFSLAIDEFTDISNQKQLAFVFRVIKGGSIGSMFFDIKEIMEADAATIFNEIEKLFETNGIP